MERGGRRGAGTDSGSMTPRGRVRGGGDGEVHRLQGAAMVVGGDKRRELTLGPIRCALNGFSDGVEDGGREQVAEGGEDGSMLRLREVAAQEGGDVMKSALYSGGGCARGEEGGGASEEGDAIAPRTRVRGERGDGGMR